MYPLSIDIVATGAPNVQTVAGHTRNSMPARNARMPAFMSSSHVDVDATIGSLAIGHIGVGAVGRPTAIHAARMRVDRQFMVDPGVFKPESLLTQPIEPGDVGQPKARNAAQLCKRLSPETQVQFYDGPLEDLDPVSFKGIDVLVVATDNLRAEVQAAQLAAHLGKPLVQAAVHGESLTLQVRFFSNSSPQSPCPVCLFGSQDWGLLNSETRFSCDAATDGRPVATTSSQPTTSLSALCSLAGEYAIIQLVRDVAKLGAPVADTVLEYNGYTHRTVVSPMARNPLCPVDHLPWDSESLSAPLPDCTLSGLLRDAGFEPNGRTTFLVKAMQFVTRGVCERGHVRQVERFVPLSGAIGRCRACEAPVQPHPLYAYRSAPEEILAPHLNRSLGSLCTESPRWVVVQQQERAVLFSTE